MPARCKLLSVFLLLSSLMAVVSMAHADSVLMEGSGTQGKDNNFFSLSAPGFWASSVAPGGPSRFSTAEVGVQQTYTWVIPAYSGENTFVGFGTDILSGGPVFTSTFTIPPSAVLAGVFTAPVSVTGEVWAYQDLTFRQGDIVQGPLIGMFKFSGTGVGTFHLHDAGQGIAMIDMAEVDFTGTGTVIMATPEPTSLLLMGTGISSLLGLVRFKTWRAHA